MPTPTDLVTDLPADFEVFGQAVDTQMKTNADAATQKATLTTKGDIYAASGTSTPARLAVGANDTVLTADSSTATGLKWATAASGGMTVLASGTLSGSAVNLTSISGSYKNLQLVIRNFRGTTDGRSLRGRFNNDVGNNYLQNDYDAAPLVDTAYTSSELTIAPATDSTTNNGIVVWEIFDYANTSTWKLSSSKCLNSGNATPTAVTNTKIDNFYNSTSAITEINLSPSSSTFSAGTYTLYGVK